MKPASVLDYRELARLRLPHFLFEYIDGGAFDEWTLSRNFADLRRVSLRQRVLRDVSKVDCSTRLFDEPVALPVALGPVGLAGLFARRGECQAARAAQAAKIPFCLSTVAACAIDEVRGSVADPFWFQLYMIRDRGFMRALMQQARQAGCRVLVFTVDMPVPGTRYRDYRSGLAGAPGLAGRARRLAQVMQRPRWAWDVGVRGRPHGLGNVAPVLGNRTGLEDFLVWMRDNFDPTVTWKDLDFVREYWRGPLVIKGILDVSDARAAAELGAEGIVVSNHGGRQLDGVCSTASILPAIADAIGERITVLADGGVRSGLDVVRMLALGAHGVLLGRAWAYGLAGDGERGVAHVLRLIEAEMKVAMALTGATAIPGLSTDILRNSAAAVG